VTVTVEPPAKVTPVTLTVHGPDPVTETDPVDAVVQPTVLEVVGAVHPPGTTTSTSPLFVPPVAAV
jgi:hypothetical protein